MSNQTRIGKINFANVWPIFHRFPTRSLEQHVQLIEQSPSQLNDALRYGKIDMGFISSFSYLQHASDYVLLPDFSISSRGKVSSILLFHQKPLHEIANGKIALTNTSATSSHMVKILFEAELGGQPEYITADPEWCLAFHYWGADAALLIGDDAIRASFSQPTHLVTDLGQWWFESTGQSMTYAVWAIRSAFAERHPQLIAEIYEALLISRAEGLSDLEPLIQNAIQQLGGNRLYWNQYFRDLQYDLTNEEIKGLQTYHQFLEQLNVPLQPFQMNLWKPYSTNQVKP